MPYMKWSRGLPTWENISDESRMFFGCLILLGGMAIFILVRLPRLLALFRTSSGWRQGYVMRHVSVEDPPLRVAQDVRRVQPSSAEEKSQDGSESTPPLDYSRNLRMPKGRGATFRYPPHVASCHKALRPFLRPMRARILPGFSFGQFLLLSVYFGVLALTAFYNSNPFLDPLPTGWIAVSQLPFIFAFAQKSSFLGAFCGFGYEKVELNRFDEDKFC